MAWIYVCIYFIKSKKKSMAAGRPAAAIVMQVQQFMVRLKYCDYLLFKVV